MTRFVLLAVPLVALLLALSAFAVDVLQPTPGGAAAAGSWRAPGRGGATPIAGRLAVSTWLLEASALTALFLLVQGRNRAGWLLDGLATALAAWLFRGPLLVLTVLGALPGSRDSWWSWSLQRLLMYAGCGLLLGLLARLLAVSR